MTRPRLRKQPQRTLRLNRRRVLPLFSAIAFGVSLAQVATEGPWTLSVAIAIYLVSLSIVLDRTGR